MPECLFNPISNSDCGCRPWPADGTTISFRCSLAPKSNLCQARWASQWAAGPGAGGPSLGPVFRPAAGCPGRRPGAEGRRCQCAIASVPVCCLSTCQWIRVHLVCWSLYQLELQVQVEVPTWRCIECADFFKRLHETATWKFEFGELFADFFSSITDFCRLRLQVYEVCRGRVLRSELTTDFKTKSALSMHWVCIKSEESARVLHKVCIRSGCFSGENTLFWKVLTVTGCTLLKCQSVNCNAIYDAIISSWKLIYDLIFMCCKTNK